MTIEYVLLMICIFGIGLKFFASAPMDAFKEAGPRLGARVEVHLATGTGFKHQGKSHRWDEAQ